MLFIDSGLYVVTLSVERTLYSYGLLCEMYCKVILYKRYSLRSLSARIIRKNVSSLLDVVPR